MIELGQVFVGLALGIPLGVLLDRFVLRPVVDRWVPIARVRGR